MGREEDRRMDRENPLKRSEFQRAINELMKVFNDDRKSTVSVLNNIIVNINAMKALLVEKGIVTDEEFEKRLNDEVERFNEQLKASAKLSDQSSEDATEQSEQNSESLN